MNKQDEVREVRCRTVENLNECSYAILRDGYFGCKCSEYCAYQLPSATSLHEEEIERLEKKYKRKAEKWDMLAKELNCTDGGQFYNDMISAITSRINREKRELSSMLDASEKAFEELLIEAKNIYSSYAPNNFRKTADEYFKEEIETLQKIKESRG